MSAIGDIIKKLLHISKETHKDYEAQALEQKKALSDDDQLREHHGHGELENQFIKFSEEEKQQKNELERTVQEEHIENEENTEKEDHLKMGAMYGSNNTPIVGDNPSSAYHSNNHSHEDHPNKHYDGSNSNQNVYQ